MKDFTTYFMFACNTSHDSSEEIIDPHIICKIHRGRERESSHFDIVKNQEKICVHEHNLMERLLTE